MIILLTVQYTEFNNEFVTLKSIINTILPITQNLEIPCTF